MADKETRLSIVIRAVDRATAKIKAIGDRLDAATKPLRNFKAALGDLREKSGLDGVIEGFKGVGSAITGLLAKVGMIGGVVAAATAGLLSLVDQFDELGDKAERIGVSVDFLAQMRYAAERSGASVEDLDSGLQGFSKSLGEARAGTGRMSAFLNKVSPALLRQLKAAKSNEQAFDLLAAAMSKLTDPAKRAALAQKTLGDAALAPLFAKGPKGIKDLRERYLELAGSQEEAAGAAGETDVALKDLKASTDGVKAALVRGLSPALTVIIGKLTTWLTGHRAEIAEWAKSIGERLPGAVQRVVEWVGKAYDKVSAFIERIGGLKTIAIVAGAILAGPLLSAIVSLGGALITAGTAMAGLFATGRIGDFISKIMDATKSMLGLKDATDQAGSAGGKKGGRASSGLRALDFVADLMPKTEAEKRQALESVFDKGLVADSFGDGGIAAQISAFRNAATATQAAKITIDLVNAPRGTRVTEDPSNTADLTTSVGYQMLPGGV